VISAAQFMLILDLTVVNVALPDLGTDMLGGQLADIFGARPMILTGLVLFTLASLANGRGESVRSI
jgi:MFS family permease